MTYLVKIILYSFLLMLPIIVLAQEEVAPEASKSNYLRGGLSNITGNVSYEFGLAENQAFNIGVYVRTATLTQVRKVGLAIGYTFYGNPAGESGFYVSAGYLSNGQYHASINGNIETTDFYGMWSLILGYRIHLGERLDLKLGAGWGTGKLGGTYAIDASVGFRLY